MSKTKPMQLKIKLKDSDYTIVAEKLEIEPEVEQICIYIAYKDGTYVQDIITVEQSTMTNKKIPIKNQIIAKVWRDEWNEDYTDLIPINVYTDNEEIINT